jgi:hypothetical protein
MEDWVATANKDDESSTSRAETNGMTTKGLIFMIISANGKFFND